MKKILITCLILLLYPQQGQSKAICPVDKSIEECCSSAGELTLGQCESSCRGTCVSGYYASCFTCDAFESSHCYPSQLRCNQAITLSEQICEKVGSQYCIFVPLPEVDLEQQLVDSCPAEATLSQDKCCCNYQ